MGVGVGALYVAGAYMDEQERQSQYREQEDYRKQQELSQAQRNEEIQEQALDNMAALSEVRSDLDRESAEISMSNQIDMLKAKANVEASAAYAGIAGSSVDQALQDLDRTYGQNLQAIAYNRSQAIDNLAFQRKEIQRSADLAKTYQTFYRPAAIDSTASALRLLGAGMQGYIVGESNFKNTKLGSGKSNSKKQ